MKASIIKWGNDDRDLSRLPKWAQQYINKLQRDKEYIQGKYNDLFDHEGSDTFLYGYTATAEDNVKPLGKGARIMFQLHDENWAGRMHVKIVEQYGKRFLTVTAGRSLFVKPSSSNVVEIHGE